MLHWSRTPRSSPARVDRMLCIEAAFHRTGKVLSARMYVQQDHHWGRKGEHSECRLPYLHVALLAL